MIELSTGMKTAMILFMLQFIVCIICCCFTVNIMRIESKRRGYFCLTSNAMDIITYCVVAPILVMSPLYGLILWIRYYLSQCPCQCLSQGHCLGKD